MTIKDQIRDEKLQYDINREAAKISASSSGKANKNNWRSRRKKKKKAIQDKGLVKTIKKYGYDDEDTPVKTKRNI